MGMQVPWMTMDFFPRSLQSAHARASSKSFVLPCVPIMLHATSTHTSSAQRDEQVGIYGFIFCIDGIWRDVIVDDQLFVKAPRWESLDAKEQKLYHGDRDAYEKIGRKGSSILYFAKSRNENETWVPLMEKVGFLERCGK